MAWLDEKLSLFADDDYVLFDCPGQIELYSHIPVMKRIANALQTRMDFRICGVYLLDSMFISDVSKFVAGSLSALSAMVSLELPHVNVLSKCDLVINKDRITKFLQCDTVDFENSLSTCLPRSKQFNTLNISICKLLEEYSLVNFLPLDVTDEDSLESVLMQVNSTIQFGEDLEPRTQDFEDGEETRAGDEE